MLLLAVTPPWLDSHAHLDDPDEPPARLDASLRALVEAGWPGTLTAGYGPERLARSRLLAEAWPTHVSRAVGIHPEYLASCEDDRAREAAFAAMVAELDHPSVVALGELGLDRRYKDAWPLASQVAFFERGLHVARERRLPVVLHVVGWYGHALAALQRVGVVAGGAVHRWSGPVELVPQFTGMGLGIALALEPRSVPEKRAALARAIPADKLLLETDWPFLDLTYADAVTALADLAHDVATWRGIDTRTLRILVEANARRLYALRP